MKRLLSVFVVLVVVSSVVFAERETVGTSGAVFLKIPAGSRPSAMGDAFTGVSDDVNAIFFNPAGTAALEKFEFSAMYYSWFQNIKYNALGVAYPAKDIGTLGLGILNLGVEGIEERINDTTTPNSTFSAGDYAYLLHYSRSFGSILNAGVNIKIIQQKIQSYTSNTAIGADVGFFHKHKDRPITLGLAIQNIGSGTKFINTTDPLPMTIKLGGAYRLINNKLLIALDVNSPRDNDIYLAVGSEYQIPINEWDFAVRLGYKTISSEKLGGLSGLGAGLGVFYKQFGFDFAWVPYGLLGDTLRYSFVVKF
ncbi:MAG: PorV/PorQ family protein [Elusimicrobiota bacterium]